MARTYKKNRARGTRASSYNVKEVEIYGGFKLGKKGKLTNKQYKEQFYNQNIREIEAKRLEQIKLLRKLDPNYNPAKSVLKDTKTYFENAYNLAADKIAKATGKTPYSAKKIFKEIGGFIASEATRAKYNLIEVIKKFDAYEDFLFYINEDLDLNKIRYEGNNTYSYTNAAGDTIRVIIDNSPVSLSIFANNSKVEYEDPSLGAN